MAANNRFDMTLPPCLRQRVEKQIALTGERMGEFTRRCLLEKLEVLEIKQAELLMVERAVQNGMSA